MFLLFLFCGFLVSAIYFNYLRHQEEAADFVQAPLNATLLEAPGVAPSRAY